MPIGEWVEGGFADPMMRKLYTPLNFGAFDLEHRLVIEAGRMVGVWKTACDPGFVLARFLDDGLVIYETNFFSGTGIFAPTDVSLHPVSGRTAFPANILGESRHTMLARIDAGLPVRLEDQLTGVTGLDRARIGTIIETYADAASRARSLGFDGVEIDGAAGTLIDLFLLDLTNGRSDDYGGSSAGRIAFLTELVDAVSRAIGADRLGIRLSPFRTDGTLRDAIFEEALRSAADQEIAYLHLVAPEALYTGRRSSQAANALRHAFPGIILSSGSPSIADAGDLIDSRWADAVCLPTAAIVQEIAGESVSSRMRPMTAPLSGPAIL